MKNIVITGFSTNDANGTNAAECFLNACTPDYLPHVISPGDVISPDDKLMPSITVKGVLPHRPIHNIDECLHKLGLPKKFISRLVPTDKYSAVSILSALKMADLDLHTVKNRNIPFIFSKNPREYSLADQLEDSALNKTRLSAYQLLSSRPEHIPDILSIHFKTHGSIFVVMASCMSGIAMLDAAINTMQQDDVDVAVVSSANSDISSHELFYFQTLGAVTTDSSGVCRPFDVDRAGFVSGSGTSTIILETEDSAISRGARIFARIGGIGTSSDGNNISSPDESSVAAEIAFNKCMKRFQGDTVDYVQAHATGTLIGDPIEARFIENHFPGVAVSSMKGHIGHHIYNANLIELCYAVQSLNTNIIVPTRHLNNPIDANLNFVVSPQKKQLNYILKNSFGFGGKNGFVLLSK